MLRLMCFLLSIAILSGCSIYSSAGRKQFEQKAPTEIVQSFSLQGCRNLSSAETWFKEEFPSNQSELVEMNSDYEVWARSLENSAVEVTVLTKADSNSNESSQSCVYQFDSKEIWQQHKKAFLQDLAKSLSDID